MVSPSLTHCQVGGEEKVLPSLTAPVLQVTGHRPMRDDLKALYILKENVRVLMDMRRVDQPGMAKWVGHSKAWINKFLNDPIAEIQIKDLDKMAEILGVSTYQLFQPGISRMAERRHAGDRRSGQERRMGQVGRDLARLQPEHAKLPRGGARGAATLRPTTSDASIQRMLAEFEKQLHAAYEAGRQDATVGGPQSVAPKRRGTPRRSVPDAS